MNALGVVRQSVSQDSLLVFGGPYSNLAATQAMYEVAQELAFKPKQIICTGDAIAYCADPEATIRLLMDWGIHWIKGNCEQAIADKRNDCGCGFDEGSACSLLSNEWFAFSRQNIPEVLHTTLNALPESILCEWGPVSILVVHATPFSMNHFVFSSSSLQDKQRWIQQTHVDVILAGHSGIPFGQRLDNNKAWLNAGVIGMPANDGQAVGWYLILTRTETTIKAQWLPLHYDVDNSIQRMNAYNMCPAYAQALNSGLWPSQDVLPESERAVSGVPIKPFELIWQADGKMP